MSKQKLHSQQIVACIWDFDKTLIPDYMQTPLFKRYKVDAQQFWQEVEALPEHYSKRGYRVNPDTLYLNHLLSYVKHGQMKGLNNAVLRQLGEELTFYPGLPDLFQELREIVTHKEDYRRHGIRLEHYIISTGLTEIIKGSLIAEHVENIYGCDFIESPLPPGFLRQGEFDLMVESEINQIGNVVDNTIKTRFIFEINKGTNKHPEISVNAKMAAEDRRVPIQNMIYIADGPSDVPVFSVVKQNGGLAYAVYNPESDAEFQQNDKLREMGRIHHYGEANYNSKSATARWLKMHIGQICDRIVCDQDAILAATIGAPPRHIHPDTEKEKKPSNKNDQDPF